MSYWTKNHRENRGGGRGLTMWGALQVMFIGFRILGLIDWPIWMVLLPMIVPVGIVLLCFAVAGIAMAIAGLVDIIRDMR